MSIHALSWVLRHSEAKNGARLVLIALADFAHDDGSKAFPSVDTLMEHSRLGRTAVRDALKRLVADGHIEEQGRTRSGTAIYLIRGVWDPGTGGSDSVARGSDSVREGTQTDPDPLLNRSSSKKTEQEAREHGEFGEWIGDHSEVTGQEVLKAGTAARKHVAAMFAARREEGYSLEELKLATRGAFADEYRQEHGHFGPESVLRPQKVAGLIEKGRRAAAPKMLRDPLTGMEFEAGTYS